MKRAFCCLMIACAWVAALPGPLVAETVALPAGLGVDLPEGWRVDGPAEGTLSVTGMRRIQFVCETQACRRTLETCTILMNDERPDGADDAARLRSLYESPHARYNRLRAVLKATSRDADILKPLEIVRWGEREWYRVETDARHNKKSGLFAETVIGGRYLGVICKTCEQGAERYRDGLALIGSLRAAGETAPEP